MVTARNDADDAKSWLDLPPTRRQTWLAIAVSVVAVVGFGVVAPFAGMPLAQLNALFPSLDAIVLVTDLITSVLLFAQFSISRSRALLALAGGYLFTALIVIPHALTFTGAFSPTGLLGANIQTGSWLFIFWHIGFAAALLAYALLRQDRPAKPIFEERTPATIGWSVATVFGLVCFLTWLSTGGVGFLPPIILDETRISPIVIYPISFAILISAAAIAVLLVRRRSLLDQWLLVVALVSIGELAFSGLLPSIRFSLGFYAGRAFSLATTSIVLIVLLAEITRLYMRLARSNAMLRREQDNKLMNLQALTVSISHEVRQPLASIALNSATAMDVIRSTPPNLEEALAALRDVLDDNRRIDQVLQNFRTLFGKADRPEAQFDLNEVVLGALRALRGALNDHGVANRIELSSEPPLIVGYGGQLQEVVINLVQNAMEAMDAVDDGHRILTVRTGRDGATNVIAEIEDTGQGIDPSSTHRIFDAFVTTKPAGTGLGLAICQMIINRHGGQLSAIPARGRGTIFRMVLPRGN